MIIMAIEVKMTRLVALLLLVVLAAPAQAEWSLLEPGLEYRQVWLAGFPGESLHQVRIDLTRLRLGLLYAPDYGKPALNSRRLARLSGAVVVVNTAYFDAGWRPLGYLATDTREFVGEIATGTTLTGMFLLTTLGPKILHRDRFQPGGEQLALQAGPRLVVDGKPVEGLVDERRRRRVGIAIDKQGRVVLYASSLSYGLTLQQCQGVLLSPSSQGGIDPAAVLNLDGGRSTQMTIEDGDFRLTVPGLRPVPVALGVFR